MLSCGAPARLLHFSFFLFDLRSPAPRSRVSVRDRARASDGGRHTARRRVRASRLRALGVARGAHDVRRLHLRVRDRVGGLLLTRHRWVFRSRRRRGGPAPARVRDARRGLEHVRPDVLRGRRGPVRDRHRAPRRGDGIALGEARARADRPHRRLRARADAGPRARLLLPRRDRPRGLRGRGDPPVPDARPPRCRPRPARPRPEPPRAVPHADPRRRGRGREGARSPLDVRRERSPLRVPRARRPRRRRRRRKAPRRLRGDDRLDLAPGRDRGEGAVRGGGSAQRRRPPRRRVGARRGRLGRRHHHRRRVLRGDETLPRRPDRGRGRRRGEGADRRRGSVRAAAGFDASPVDERRGGSRRPPPPRLRLRPLAGGGAVGAVQTRGALRRVRRGRGRGARGAPGPVPARVRHRAVGRRARVAPPRVG